jgi:hypothetical protein
MKIFLGPRVARSGSFFSGLPPAPAAARRAALSPRVALVPAISPKGVWDLP